jgi:uncharacterized Zn-finger protein
MFSNRFKISDTVAVVRVSSFITFFPACRFHEGAEVTEVVEKATDNFLTLRNHLAVLTGEKLYKCAQCTESLVTKGISQRHIRVHILEKCLRCTHCTKSFAESSGLTKHFIRVHTGERPYSCSQCAKSFVTERNLQRHIKVHTLEKLHICPRCTKSCVHCSFLYPDETFKMSQW